MVIISWFDFTVNGMLNFTRIDVFVRDFACKLPDLSSLCREIMHAMWKPQKFKYIYLFATLYVFTLTIPSATAVYWAFGDQLLNHSNAFSLLPKTAWRDTAVILMLIHQVCLQFSFT